ncbi:hypothetical protein ACFPPD_20765 [Cohnella suwonensis]|uniref:Uncharacterized protein n=1 Tax=Cohnella suwonensis TaxID=696072 RepID=A0ABW0LZ75_9BACL
MNDFASKWEATRNQGKQKYTMKYGVLYIGMTATILLSVLDWISNGSVSVVYLCSRILVLPMIGAIIVGMRWEGMEKKYAKLKSDAEAKA